MPNSLFTITPDGSTNHYLSAAYGSLADVLAMLYREEHERDSRLIHEKALLKPLDADDYGARLLAFQSKPKADRVVTIDHDADHFEYAEWTPDGIRTLSGPLGEMLSAFSAALSRKEGAQPLPDEKLLTAKMEQLSSVETTFAVPWTSAQDENDEQKHTI